MVGNIEPPARRRAFKRPTLMRASTVSPVAVVCRGERISTTRWRTIARCRICRGTATPVHDNRARGNRLARRAIPGDAVEIEAHPAGDWTVIVRGFVAVDVGWDQHDLGDAEPHLPAPTATTFASISPCSTTS